ncbi:SRPBCC family protein [Aquimarina rhabdastrellae]
MKYTHAIELELSRDQVLQKFEDENTMKHWQKGFISITHISGNKGKTGAVSTLQYKMGKRVVDMVETITHENLPDEIHFTFDTKNVYNIQQNFFKVLPNGHTKWIAKNEFKFGGFMKIIGFLFPNAFKKQSYAYMSAFKTYIEDGISVQDTNASC